MANTGNPFLDALADQFLNSNQTAAWNSIFGSQMRGNNKNYSNFLRGQSDNYFGQYLGELPNDVGLKYTTFLGRQNPYDEFMKLTPRQRGETPGLYSPKTRYIG